MRCLSDIFYKPRFFSNSIIYHNPVQIQCRNRCPAMLIEIMEVMIDVLKIFENSQENLHGEVPY